MDMRGRIVALSDLFMPRHCVVCGRTLGMREKHLCLWCQADIPYTYNWTESHNTMADKYNLLIQRDIEKSGIPKYEPYSYAAALFFYRTGSQYREITRSLKYHGNMGIGRWAGDALGERLSRSALYADVDVVVPVPLHWTRRWRRGYNQAEVIARRIAAALGCSAAPRLLVRCRRTRTQTHLSVDKKASNVSGAFKPGHTLPKAHHLLLVDDVFTTGATVNECRKVLRAIYGPEVRISVATLGFVGD